MHMGERETIKKNAFVKGMHFSVKKEAYECMMMEEKGHRGVK